MKLIKGKSIAEKILKQITKEIKKLKTTPKLAVILVGEDKPSKIYLKNKKQAAEKVGIDFELHKFSENISQDELVEKIGQIQDDPNLSGLIIQLPLPKHLDRDKILNTVKPELDVDCLTDANLEKLNHPNPKLIPPTPAAILTILSEYNFELKNKKIVVVGLGKLVGGPLVKILKQFDLNITTCDINTANLTKETIQADILITAVGKKNLITGDMVKQGAIVIDAGSVFENDKMYGDVDFESVCNKASYITPTPGGVGPITVAHLLKNLVKIEHR